MEDRYWSPLVTCPECKLVHNMHTCITAEEAKPAKGDVSVCISCGAFNEFDEAGELITLTEEKLQILRKENPKFYSKMLQAKYYIRRGKEDNNGK